MKKVECQTIEKEMRKSVVIAENAVNIILIERCYCANMLWH